MPDQLLYTVIDLQKEGIIRVEDGNHGEYRPRPNEFCDQGVAFIRAADLDGGAVLFDRASKINAKARQRITKGIGKPGDILISHKGTIGKIARAPADSPEFVCSPQTTFWRSLNSEKLDQDFLYVLMRSPAFQADFAVRSGETDMAGYVSLTSQRQLRILIPPLNIQHQIAEIVGALDDKIELNRRMNETLEAMAQAIFRDWFVDFGPTRRQMAGATDPVQIMGGLTPDPEKAATLAPLFPPTLAANGLPEGWEERPLLAIARLISGGTPSTKERRYWDGPIKWASAKDVSQCGEPFLLETEKTITEFGLEKSSTRIVPKLATVVVARGATTGRFCLFGEDTAMNQTCYALVSKEGTPYLLRQIFGHLVENLVLGGHGSVFNTITTRTLEHATAVCPQQKAGLMFEDFVTPFFERMLSNQKESRTLAAMRDLLLPKLMSGEIHLRDAERAVGEAAE